MTDMLTRWWEHDCAQERQNMFPIYPLPHDGASNVIMNNFFATVGMADDRVASPQRLQALVYLARPVITEKFLELWPKIPATIGPVNEPNP